MISESISEHLIFQIFPGPPDPPGICTLAHALINVGDEHFCILQLVLTGYFTQEPMRSTKSKIFMKVLIAKELHLMSLLPHFLHI